MTSKVCKAPGRRRKAPPAAEVIARNVDLLSEILIWLPKKSLLRFKRVSRHWLSLISDPQFARYYLRRNPTPYISGLYFYMNEKLESVSLQGSPTLPTLSFVDDGLPGRGGGFLSIMIVHSCNGLLLCVKYDGNYKTRYIVCNPTTQKYLVLPQSQFDEDGHVSGVDQIFTSLQSHLVFDPSKSNYYKVVLFHSNFMEIYSSEVEYWKMIPAPHRGGSNRVFWNGAIHWLTHDSSTLTHDNGLSRLDVDEEKIIELPNPSRPEIFSLERIVYFGECGGHLLMVQTHSSSYMEFRILQINHDYSRSVVRPWFNLRSLIPAFPHISNENCVVLRVVKGEKKKAFTLVLSVPDKVISYNVTSNTWNVLRGLGVGLPYKDFFGYVRVYPYVESLSVV